MTLREPGANSEDDGRHGGSTGRVKKRVTVEERRAKWRAAYYAAKKKVKKKTAKKTVVRAVPKKKPLREVSSGRADAVVFLRHATKRDCPQCGAPQPALSKSELYALLARAALEE